jgi:hypothetical protein
MGARASARLDAAAPERQSLICIPGEAHFEKALQPPAWNVRLFLKIESKQMLEWCAR